MSGAYYNEYDPKAAAWLRELIRAGHIADGEVDERSIADVRPDDLRGFRQCHFFAGIGGWSYALRLAGWPDDRPVWTGSCPCQPFSAAGKGEGFNDPRHLWPEFFRLIRESRPDTVVGEQVSSNLAWLDLVSGDLEGEGYAVGAAIVGAHSVGAPHLRQRLYWAADARAERRDGESVRLQRRGSQQARAEAAGGGPTERLADALPAGRAEGRTESGAGSVARSGELGGLADRDPARRGTGWAGETGDGRDAPRVEPPGLCAAGGLAHALRKRGRGGQPRGTDAGDAWESGETHRLALPDGRDASAEGLQRGGEHGREPQDGGAGFWADADWLSCRDGVYRPVEPGTFPLAHGVPARVGRLRGYGNAIVPQVAAAFVRAYLAAAAARPEEDR